MLFIRTIATVPRIIEYSNLNAVYIVAYLSLVHQHVPLVSAPTHILLALYWPLRRELFLCSFNLSGCHATSNVLALSP